MDSTEEARKLIREGKVAEGLAMFDRLLARSDIATAPVLRERSRALASLRRFEAALRDRETLLTLETSPCIGDAYFAGECAIEAGLLREAFAHFDRAIQLSIAASDDYYLTASRLLKAYCHACLGQAELARGELELVEDDAEILWLAGIERITKATVLAQIESHPPQ